VSSHAHERNPIDGAYQSVSHTIWDCKYPVVLIPKCSRNALHIELRRYLGGEFRNLGAEKER
jgi:putative transposase